MTEQNPPTSSPTPPPDPGPEPAPLGTKKKKTKRTWKQRLKIAALVAIILLLVFRVAINLLLPTVIDRVARTFDLDCAYSRMNLSTLSGNAHIWGLTLRPKAGGDSIVSAEYVQGEISVLNLLRGRLVVYRAEVDGVDILIDREPDGAIPLLKMLTGPNAGQPAPATPTPTPKGGKTQPVNLEAPLRVDAIRLTHVNTRVRDRSVSPVFEANIQTTVRISDVGSDQRPAIFELEVAADPLFDTLLVRGEAHNTPTSIDAAGSIVLRGVHPKPAAAYLLPLGLKPFADSITIRAKMNLKAAAIPNTSDVSANLSLDGISAFVDNDEWAALDKLTLNAKKLNGTTIELGELLIEGARASARRTPAGGLRIAGLELTPAPASDRPPSPPQKLPAGFRFALDELRMKDLRATFDDQAVAPVGNIVAKLDAMSIKNVVLDANHPDEKATISGSASVPGVIQAVQLSGTATPFAAKRHVDLKLTAEGIKPDALAPYLAQLGLESELKNGRFAGQLSADVSDPAGGAMTADASISSIQFSDGADLLSMGAAKIGGFGIDPTTGAIKVASIEVSGPALLARRQASGNLAAMGLRTRAEGPARSAPTAIENASTHPIARPTTTPTPSALPRIEIGKFVWKDVKLQFSDEMGGTGQAVSIGDAGIEASDLVIDPQSNTPGKPGRFRAWISTPKLADRLAVEGTLTPGSQGIAIESAVSGTGITAEAIAPYLKPFGIVPMLADGRLNLKANATVAMIDGGLSSSLDLQNVAYKDGGNELAGLDGLHVSEVAIKASGIEVGQIQIDRPRARVARNADGSFQAGGIRLVSVAPASQPAAPIATSPTTAPASFKLPPAPIVATLKALHLTDGSITWTDNATTQPVNTTIAGSVDLNDLRIGPPDSSPATLNVTGRIDGVVDKATITGTLSAAPEAPGAKLKIVADGIRAGSLAAYLPPGIATTLKSGHFSGALDVAAANNPAGGLSAHLLVNDIDFNDGAEFPLLKLDSFKVAASRIDPDGEAIVIEEISSAGFEADARLGTDGAFEAGGIRLVANAAPTSQPAPNAQPASAPEVSPATQPAPDLKAMVALARKPLPLLSIEKVDLEVKRLTIAGATGPNGAPVSVEGLTLRNRGRIEVGGKDAETRPPVALEASGRIAPLIGNFTTNTQATPLAATPTLSIDITASDIDGKGLTDVLPQLKPGIDGSGLTHGNFRSHLDATINYGRRGPRDLDLARGFTLDFDVKPVEFRSEPGGPVIGGLEEIRSDGIKVEPATGNVRIKSIEITKPIGRIARDAKGIRAFGLLIPMAAATTQPAPRVSESAVAEAPAPAPPTANASPMARPPSDIRLDRLTVSGIDVIIEDTTTTPKTLIPLNGLDVDVRDISNQMPFDGKPMRFSVLVTSDKVPLPYRKGGGGSPSPAAQPAAAAVGPNMEMRELFSQITANGVVAVKPVGDHFALDGWAKTSVNGFELLGVSGLAKQYDVTIGGGIFDDANDIRFNPTGKIETKNTLVLTNLSLSEPPNGPIQTALKISAPIDVAIGMVTDPDGSITMNLPVPIKNGAISTGDVVGPAVGAVAGVLTTAIASAPVKAISGVGNLLGLGGNKQSAPEQTVAIRFLPGYTGLDAPSSQALGDLLRRMQKESTLELQLRHELSAADVTRAGIRANPSPEECRTIAERLRREKADLIARRAVLAGAARGELGSRPESQARATLDSLRTVDRQIAQTENALDQLYELLRPGAARQADRRTRAASLDIAQQRLASVRSTLLASSVAGADQRIHQTNPQFAPTDSTEGGEVVITLVPKKK